MADRWAASFCIMLGLLPLAACSNVQTASKRQAYFETASTAKLAWQPMPNDSTGFQGCAWGSESYPCRPYSKLDVPRQNTAASVKHVSTHTPSHKKIRHKKKVLRPQSLPLCLPIPNTSMQDASQHQTNT